MLTDKTFIKTINSLFTKIDKTIKTKENYLLENTYFLDDDSILCLSRKHGVSRFPYGKDGFTLWAYSSGYISINESTFYVVLPTDEGKEPYLSFFFGDKKGDSYIPYSIMGKGKSYLENNATRYVVYTKEAVYYLLKTSSFRSALRIFVSEDKKVNFTVYLKNRSKTTKEIYMSSYMNCLFKYTSGECIETKWFKKCFYNDNNFYFESPEDIDRFTHIDNYGLINREFILNQPNRLSNTTSRSIYTGEYEGSVISSSSLKKGCFEKEKLVTHFTDTAVMGDILTYSLKSKEEIINSYSISFNHESIDSLTPLSFEQTNNLLNECIKENKKKYLGKNMLKIRFEQWKDNKVKTNILNKFIDNVIYQTEYCGLAKNSGALFLGVRDVMQQIEAALIWNPRDCRKKILEVLSFIDPSGNPPRQYSIPAKGTNPRMDLRDFIDQGCWIISTVYNYLAYTDDFSILNEKVGYYERQDNGVVLSNIVDTVFEHLIKVGDYLISKIDPKTNCLRAMYGDWNDALDGLGISNKPNTRYGNGVSMMATFQLYENLSQLIEICKRMNAYIPKINYYIGIRTNIENGVKEHAVKSENGQKKIVHGWGEDQSYYVGSFFDVDNKSRYSLTSYSFYVISKMNKLNYLSHEDILKAFHGLDSKYGFKTFEPYFEKDVKGVGRIVNLPKGTAENGATYIHGSLFGSLALLNINEEKIAYDNIVKLLPFTHDLLTTSPFIMPNSYSYNIESDMDGESMSDWYTGSANTLIKTFVRGSFGIYPDLFGLRIFIRDYFPSSSASISLKIKGSLVKIKYQNINQGKRSIKLNGNKIDDHEIYLDNDFIKKTKTIEINIFD